MIWALVLSYNEKSVPYSVVNWQSSHEKAVVLSFCVHFNMQFLLKAAIQHNPWLKQTCVHVNKSKAKEQE